MATVIDSLIVELTLDPTKFTAKQQEAVESLRKFESQVHTNAVSTETSAKRIGSAIGGIKTQVLEMFAAYAGGKGLITFVTDLTNADAQLGKVSRATGISAAELSRWQGVARLTGGSAEDMAQSFKSISDVFTAWQVGGPEAPGVMAILSRITQEAQRLDGAHAKIFDPSKGQSQYFKDLADNLKIIHDLSADKNLASYLSGKVGVGGDLFDILQRGAGGAQQLLDIVQKLGPATQDSVNAATELQRRWNAIFLRSEGAGREAGIIPGILKVSDFLNMTPSDAWAYLNRTDRATSAPGGSLPFKNVFPAAGDSGAFSSQSAKESFIRAEAVRRGIDPDVAMRVAKSEGFNNFQSTVVTKDGSREKSWGAFQLYTGGGLGNDFKKATGLDPSDPANERATIQFALDNARRSGWGAFHGAANNGIGSWQGINRNATVNITGPITVTGVKDPTDFTNKLRDIGLKRQAEANQSPVGGQ